MRDTEKRIQMYQAKLPYMKERVLAALVLFAYFVSNVFETLGVEQAIGTLIQSFNMPKI